MWLLTPKGLDRVRDYANAIGPYKEFYTVGVESILEQGFFKTGLQFLHQSNSPQGGFIGPDLLSREAQARGLEQIVYTFYSSYEPAQSVCILKGLISSFVSDHKDVHVFKIAD